MERVELTERQVDKAIEAREELVTQLGLIVVRDDQHFRVELPDALDSIVHLHEMRAADESPGVSQERDDDGPAGPRLEAEPSSTKLGKIEWRSGVADPR